jgi:hypothetical protein
VPGGWLACRVVAKRSLMVAVDLGMVPATALGVDDPIGLSQSSQTYCKLVPRACWMSVAVKVATLYGLRAGAQW